MNPLNFEAEWQKLFQQKIPIGDLFKHYFSDHWVRIYNPIQSAQDNSKNQNDLLKHQNKIISDCIEDNDLIFIVSGRYSSSNIQISIPDQTLHLNYTYKSCTPIHLHQAAPQFFDDGENNDIYFTPVATASIWQQNKHNDLLLKINDDAISAFIIHFEKKIIIYPYDRGIDLILFDHKARHIIKEKYKTSLSIRDDGL